MGEAIFDRKPLRVLEAGDVDLAYYEVDDERVYVTAPRKGETAANIFFMHGLTDHAARQFHNAVWLAKEGYRTILFDLAGHGGREADLEETWWLKEAYLAANGNPGEVARAISRREADDPRLQLKVRSIEYNVLMTTRVLHHFAQADRVFDELLSSRWAANDKPLVLMGHSLGGLLSIDTVRRCRRRSIEALKGLILIAPAFKPNGRPGNPIEIAAIDAVWELRRLPFWAFPPVTLLRPLAKSALELNFPLDTTWGVDYLSDQPDENRLVTVDPQSLRALPSTYISSIEGYMAECDLMEPSMLPDTILFLPEEDGIVTVGGGLRFARRAGSVLGQDRFTMVRYGGLRAHDLLRSSVRYEMRNRLRSWLRRLLRR